VHGICGADRDDMFVNVIPVHVVEMAVMKVVNMGVMANSRVPAVRAVLVGMVGMVRLGAGDHEIPLPLVCDPVDCFSGYILSHIAPFGLLGCWKVIGQSLPADLHHSTLEKVRALTRRSFPTSRRGEDCVEAVDRPPRSLCITLHRTDAR
jgi:hypothetical protein